MIVKLGLERRLRKPIGTKWIPHNGPDNTSDNFPVQKNSFQDGVTLYSFQWGPELHNTSKLVGWSSTNRIFVPSTHVKIESSLNAFNCICSTEYKLSLPSKVGDSFLTWVRTYFGIKGPLTGCHSFEGLLWRPEITPLYTSMIVLVE